MSVLKRTFMEFKDDNLTDWAAALTYYAVLSVFPALLVFVALLSLFGQHPETTQKILDIVDQVGPDDAVTFFKGTIKSITKSQGGGAFLSLGLLGAVWSSSGYVAAFMRACDSIYEVEVERTWKKFPLRVGITVVMVVLVGAAAVAVVVTGPVAEAIGNVVGLGDTAVTIWEIAKWPVLLGLMIGMVSVLYYLAPNARQRGFKWITPGGALAVVIWILASVALGVYAANFASYEETYGSIGAVIIFLLWLYITNNALLFGAELNAEIERNKELKEGLPAEDEIQLPPRDVKKQKVASTGSSE